MNIDHKYSHAFFNATKKFWLTRHLAVAASTHLIWLMLGVVVGILSWNQLNYTFIVDPELALFFIMLVPAWVVTMVISKLVNRKRPYLETKQKALIDPFIHTASFPSSHAMFAFSIVALTFETPGLLPYMLLAATIVALGRVAAGVHFFSDVIVGAGLGFLVTRAAEIGLTLLVLASK